MERITDTISQALQDQMERLTIAGLERSTTTSNKCPICKDIGAIYTIVDGIEYARECECRVKERISRQIEKSGLTDAFRRRRLSTFNPLTKSLQEAKERAYRYILETSPKSMMIFGQIGGGKTHLAIGVANELLDKGVAVRYTGYRELVNSIKPLAMDLEERNRALNPYKNTTVLIIDDLYKGQATEADQALIYEIINDRYLNNKATIITTEKNLGQLMNIDEAAITRILEQSEGYCIGINATNYRVYKGVQNEPD